jgi:ribose 5-phosphate isomerase B
MVDVFLNTPFSNDDRHIRRIGMISKYEKEGTL